MKLRTFGRVHVVRNDGTEVALQPLPLALLAYLSVGGPRDRQHLAGLFWHNSKNGLNSLSTTLNRIRAELPESIWVRGSDLIGTDLPSDVDDVRSAIDRSDFEAVERLYSDAFLGGFKVRGQSVEFEEWVLDERTTLAAMVELALLQRGRKLYEAGEHQAGALAVEQAWETATRDGFPSPDYFEEYHRILAAAARPTASVVRSMAAEFGISLRPVNPVAFEPPIEKAEASRSGAVDATTLSVNPAGTRSATPLFGCEKELGAIALSVASQGLTTVVGLGGSGKTRLAAEYFGSPRVETDFPRRYWVNLEEVTDQDLVGPAIATSLGQRFDSVESLADWLGADDPVLVVLDNFEHVLASTGVVQELTQRNDGLRILVTSRVPLEVAGESLVQLRGLDTAEHAVDSPAAQLFVSSARRAGVSEDRLSTTSPATIHDVCRRVGGNPLALEIAGGWVLVLSPAEILESLAQDNELLDAPMTGDLRSMDLVLNQSWSTLHETERNTLMLLATFPAGCPTSEALKLQELSIRSIGRLVQHSLVRLQIEGRISLHPLIASHALSELRQRPNLEHDFHQVLSNWCQNFSATVLSNTNSTHSQAFDAEIANFTKSWLWNAKQESWGMLERTLEPLREFFTESGRVREGLALFAVMADALRSAKNAAQDLSAAVIEAHGWFQLLSGELTQARLLLAEALKLSSGDDRHAHAQILRSLGVLHLTLGEIPEAAAYPTEALALVGDDVCTLAASLQHDLAVVHLYRGDRAEAADAARLALQAGRSANNLSVVTSSYLLLADIQVASDPERAIVLLNEGWIVAKSASLDNLAIYFPSILGVAHLHLQKAELAASYFTEGIEAADKVGQLGMVGANYVGRAEARVLRDQAAGAIEDLKTGIRLALKTNSGRYLMWAAVVSCQVTAIGQTPARALLAKELLVLAFRHPAADQDARDKAAKTLRELFDEEPPHGETVSDADQESLDEVAERSLQLLTLR